MKTEPATPSAKKKVIQKDRRHDHFWIENGSLCETYRTIRGLRWRWVAFAGQEPDHEKISDDELTALGFEVQSFPPTL